MGGSDASGVKEGGGGRRGGGRRGGGRRTVGGWERGGSVGFEISHCFVEYISRDARRELRVSLYVEMALGSDLENLWQKQSQNRKS